MSDVNLLPEELRKKETEEQKRRTNQTPSFDIALTNPKEAKKANWFSRVFGKPVSPIVSSSRYQPSVNDQPAVILPTFKSSVPANLPFNEEPSKNNFPRPIFKEAMKMPITENNRPIKSQMASQSAVSSLVNQSKPGIFLPTVKKNSWWHILSDLFSRSKKSEPEIRLAKAPEMTAISAAAPVNFAEFGSKPGSEQAKSGKGGKPKKSGGYHTVIPLKHNRHTYINLIPSELLRGEAGGVSWLRIVLAMILPALLVFFCYLGMNWLQGDINQKISTGRKDLTQLQKSVGDYNERARINNDTANRVITLKKLLDNRIYWSKFFVLLEKYTLDGVYFKEFKADIAGLISLPAAADNYETLARQLVVLRNAGDFVKDARTTSMQVSADPKAGVTGVDFLLRLTLAEGVFRQLTK